MISKGGISREKPSKINADKAGCYGSALPELKKEGKCATDPLKKFRLSFRQIIADDHMPFDRMELTEDDLVIFRPHTAKAALTPSIALPDWAEHKGRGIARKKGCAYHVLRSNWLEMAIEEASKGNPPKNARAAFVGYCKKQNNLR